jgi:hypothetical protein
MLTGILGPFQISHDFSYRAQTGQVASRAQILPPVRPPALQMSEPLSGFRSPYLVEVGADGNVAFAAGGAEGEQTAQTYAKGCYRHL